jgi:hypothetical protein
MILAAKELLILAGINIYMENITHPETLLKDPLPAGKVAVNYIIDAFLIICNNSKSIFSKTIFCRVIFHKTFLLLNLFLLAGMFRTSAQQNVNYALYANIIYRFTKYINWPDDKKSGVFIIGIVGDSPLYDEIKSFTANKTVGNQKIVIKTFSSGAAVYNCQILFISEDESRSLKKIAIVTTGTSTLLISESTGLAYKGSCINFIIANEHLKLEINKTNIEDRHLDIASELLSLGTVVK